MKHGYILRLRYLGHHWIMYRQLPEWGHCPGTATENVTKLKALLLRQRNVQDCN